MANRLYGTLEYVTKNHDKDGFWKISGPQPAIMASRIIPNCWSRDTGTVEIPDNISNVEHIEWLMIRYPLEIKSSKQWTARIEQLQNIRERRTNLMVLSEPVVDARFTGTLYPFQKTGLDFLIKTSGNALVADEMGLGKTPLSLAYLVTESDAFPCLIIAPLVTLINWQREIARFICHESGRPFKVRTIRSGKPGDLDWSQGTIVADNNGTMQIYDDGPPQIYLINYDLVSKRRDDLARLPLCTIIADEVQHLRNPESQKSMAVRELANVSTVKHRIGLSGTPCYNHGREIWSICDFIFTGLLGTYGEFVREFVNQWDPRGSVSSEKRAALYEILTQNIMIRRRKIDVLTDLPEKVRYRQTIQIDDAYYAAEMQKHMARLNEKLAAAKAKTQFQAISEIEAYADFNNNERITAGIAKVPYVVEFIHELMETDEAVVVFCHHKIVHDMLYERLFRYSPVVVRGGQTDSRRQEEIDAFQMGNTKLMIAGLRAGGLGINLTTASYVIFAELDWTPAIHRQCFVPETIIAGAYRQISQYSVGQIAFGLHGIGQVSSVMHREYHGLMVKIHPMGCLPLVLTPDHPIWAIRRKKVRCRIKSGGRTSKWNYKNPDWRNAEDIQVTRKTSNGDCLLIPRQKGTDKTVTLDLRSFTNAHGLSVAMGMNVPLEIPLTTDFSWLIGLYIAEGSPRLKAGQSAFNLGEDEQELADEVCRIAESLGYTAKASRIANRHELRVVINSIILARFLKHHCGAKASEKRIPDFILNHISDEIVNACIRGYLAGDGCGRVAKDTRNGRNIEDAATVSIVLALQLQFITVRLGNPFLVWAGTPAKNRAIHGVVIKKSQVQYRLRRNVGVPCKQLIITPDYVLFPVRRIKKIDYDGVIWNLEKNFGNRDSTYLANNLIVHNCEDRLHRIGQKKTVFAYYLEGVGTCDEHIAEVLVNKKLELDEILGDVNRSDQYSETEKLSEQTKMLVEKLQERFKIIKAETPLQSSEALEERNV